MKIDDNTAAKVEIILWSYVELGCTKKKIMSIMIGIIWCKQWLLVTVMVQSIRLPLSVRSELLLVCSGPALQPLNVRNPDSL